MKKLLLSLAILSACTAAVAQNRPKNVAEAKSALQSAIADSQNPKRSEKTQTWLNLAQSYVDAYAAAQGNGIIGSSFTEVNLMMSKNNFSQEKEVALADGKYLMRKYYTADYYFSLATPDKRLSFIKITRPVTDMALEKALKAYEKAFALDAKAKKTKDIKAGVELIVEKFSQEAVLAYSLNQMPEASLYFEKQAEASATAPLSVVDSSSIYNAGLTALMAKDYDRAETFFNKCLDINYTGKTGEVYAKLSQIAELKNDKDGVRKYLEAGFEKFPDSEIILVGLINYYMASGENSDRIFVLLDKVKQKDPTNASLYSVEGDIHEKLGHFEKAKECWRKSVEVDPKFANGYFAEGYFYLKQSDEISKQANELPANEYKKYDELVKQYEDNLKLAIPLIDKAYGLETDEDRKNAYAGLLKNASFRLRQDPQYKEVYDKYNAIYKN